MGATDGANPFEAPETDDPGVRPRGVREERRALVVFLARRALLIGVIPALFGVVALTWRLAPFWVAVVAIWIVFVPTTAAVLVDRFLAAVTDPLPVNLSTGLRMDRDRFRRLIRVIAGERLAFAVMLIAVAVVLLPTALGLLAPFLFLLAAWTTWFAVQHVRIGDAIVAQVEEDPHEILRKLTPVVRWPRLNRPMLDGALLGVANAEVLLGEPTAAIETLSRVRPNGMQQAHLARAALLAAQGRVEEARRAIAHREPTNLGEELAMLRAVAAIALEEGHAAEVIASAAEWGPLYAQSPPQGREVLDLIHAAALALDGRAADARDLLARRGATHTDRPYLRASWPRLWDALDALPTATPREPA